MIISLLQGFTYIITLKYKNPFHMPMIPFKEVNVLDINSAYLGIPTSQLMENAGEKTAKTAMERFEIKGKKIAVICGPGNNGGDGYVAARYLSDNCEVALFLVKPEGSIRSEISKANFEKIKGKITVLDASILKKNIESTSLIIDCMLGIGISGEIRDPYLSCIKQVNELDIPVLSVDVPSGLGAKDSVQPKITVTFHDTKEGMTKENSGEIVIADIGIPKDAERFCGPGEFVFYPKPKLNSHKGDNGRLLVIGGGPYSGAPALAGLSAYRIGVDLVHIATPKKTYKIIASYSPNFIVHKLSGKVFVKEDLEVVFGLLDKVDAVVLGPGIGDHPDTSSAVLEFIKAYNKPLVIDADAIKAISSNPDVLKGKSGIITPHAGEFRILNGENIEADLEKRTEQVKALSGKLGVTILLKGEIDIISDGKYIKLNKTGNPAMSVGGTGDVLAGLCGGMLSKGISPYASARIGAFTNGTAGDLAFKDLGFSMMATDVIDKIPIVLNSFIR
jgi:NAD(P)H-hydrate epimerase